MISIEEAIRLVDSQEVSRTPITLRLSQSLNHYLAKPVIASFDLPSFDNSAMDGYAISGSGPSYEVIGEIKAGDTSRYKLDPGQAYRIFTGAKVPESCDSVIMQERTTRQGSKVIVEGEIVPGKNIRRKGEQISKGDQVFGAGQLINPSVLGLLTSLGHTEISTFRRPRIGLITTGDELVQQGGILKEGQLFESNSITLVSTLSQMGFPLNHHHVPDDFESTKNVISNMLAEVDVLLISGGISVGDYDFVKKALELNHVQEVFYKVFQKPGKPLYFGKRSSTVIFGLPGNPASSLVCLYVYVVPLLKKIMGSEKAEPPWVHLPMATDFDMPFDRPSFMKAKISAEGVHILEGQGSSMLLSMANGNALTLLEPRINVKKGEFIRCLLTNTSY